MYEEICYKYLVQPSSMECIVFDEDTTIAIYETGQRREPNVERIIEILKQFLRTKSIKKDDLLNMIEEFVTEYPKYSHELETIQKEIQNSTLEIFEKNKVLSSGNIKQNVEESDEEFERRKPFFNGKSSMGGDFIRFCEEQYNLILNPGLRSKANSDLVLDAYKDIHYRYLEDQSLEYSVGSRQAPNQSIDKSVRIRKMVVFNGEGKHLLEELITQCEISFVRNKGYTVLPFPIKIAKEVYRMYK